MSTFPPPLKTYELTLVPWDLYVRRHYDRLEDIVFKCRATGYYIGAIMQEIDPECVLHLLHSRELE